MTSVGRSASREATAVGFLALLLVSPPAGGVPPEAGSPPRMECRLDSVGGVPSRGGYLVVDGWAVDRTEGTPVYKVGLALEKKGFFELDRGGPRFDIPRALGRPEFLRSGFHGAVPLGDTPPGVVRVEAVAYARDGHMQGCGAHAVVVRDAPLPPQPPAWRIGLTHVSRALAALLIFALAGWPLTAWAARGTRPLAAPLVGFALFAVTSEAGALVYVRPLPSFLAAGAALLAIQAAGKVFPRRRARTGDAPFVAGAALVLLLVGAIPMSVHGPGVVMGGIDDAVRECMKADTILVPSRTGEGYAALLPRLMDQRHLRPGSSYLLAALAQPGGLRTHEVHSAAMLLAGTLTVFGAGVLARALLPAARATRRAAVALVATSSVLVTTLYGQHLGNLAAVPLLLLFTAASWEAVRRPRPFALLSAVLSLSALFTVYPELLPLLAMMAAAATLLRASGGGVVRAALHLAAVATLAAVLNAPGAFRLVRGWTAMGTDLVSKAPADRLVLGDTTWFPPAAVVAGLEPYRLDAPAPMLPLRRTAVDVAALGVALAALTGFLASPLRTRRTVATLLLPVAFALLANRAMAFPYGYSKVLPVAVPLWTVSFMILCGEATRLAGRFLPPTAVRIASAAGLAVLLVLSGLATRHVISRASLLVPAFDPAYNELPALLSGLPPRALPRVDQPLFANREWMRYMLRDVNVDATAEPIPATGRPRFALLDRRTLDGEPADVATRTPRFVAVPLRPDP